MSLSEPLPDTIYLFSYTSGTTGDPKGVMLSNKNILAPSSKPESRGFIVDNSDTHISYLPLAHSFE